MPAPNRAVMLCLRAEWKRDGICTRCGKGEAAKDHTRCTDCLGYDEWFRKRKKALVLISTEAHSTHAATFASS